MNHLETLVRQFYEWQGYFVRGNVKVGKLSHGGWAGELDVVAYHPNTKHLIHIEPSIDALSWKERESRFKKKFDIGRKHIYRDIFPWLVESIPLDQLAILIGTGKGLEKIGGGRLESIDDFMLRVKRKIRAEGVMVKNAIPEEYGLLRTIQMTICGYRCVKDMGGIAK